MIPLKPPNWESGVQNQPIANEAVSSFWGILRSIWGMLFCITEEVSLFYAMMFLIITKIIAKHLQEYGDLHFDMVQTFTRHPARKNRLR
jgi:hypothetical protein